MDDREVVAAIAAGDPTGIAVAYDKYAAALYGYCQWMLRHPASAAEATRDTFVITATTLGDLPEPPNLRPWLYGVARRECQQQLQKAAAATRGGAADAAGQPATVPDLPAGTADLPTGEPDLLADVSDDPGHAELPALNLGILAEPEPRSQAIVELTVGSDVDDGDLARTGREACPTLDALLAGSDRPLTGKVRELVRAHMEQCEICAVRSRGTPGPVAPSALPGPAALPGGLREQVLRLSFPTARAVAADYERAAQRTESARLANPDDGIADHGQVDRHAEATRFARFSRAITAMRRSPR
jgi:DNA-directed RNA polymerase specialized sigma24 family protein